MSRKGDVLKRRAEEMEAQRKRVQTKEGKMSKNLNAGATVKTEVPAVQTAPNVSDVKVKKEENTLTEILGMTANEILDTYMQSGGGKGSKKHDLKLVLKIDVGRNEQGVIIPGVDKTFTTIKEFLSYVKFTPRKVNGDAVGFDPWKVTLNYLRIIEAVKGAKIQGSMYDRTPVNTAEELRVLVNQNRSKVSRIRECKFKIA